MKNIRNLAGIITVLGLSVAAFAEQVEGAQTAAAHVALPSWPLIRAVLLGALWLFVAAIVLGVPIKWWLGDLWQRKNNQPFSDDAGGHGHVAAGAHSAAHH